MLMLSTFFVPSGVQQDLDRSLSLLKLEEVNMYVCMYVYILQNNNKQKPMFRLLLLLVLQIK
jgi:hypothetical protein